MGGGQPREVTFAHSNFSKPQFVINDLSDLSSNRSTDRPLMEFDTEHPYDVNLLCANAAQHFAIMSHLGANLFEERYNIGAWAWELPRFPEKWYDRFAYYDEVSG